MESTLWQFYDKTLIADEDKLILQKFLQTSFKIMPLLFLKREESFRVEQSPILIFTKWGDNYREYFAFLQSDLSLQAVKILTKYPLKANPILFIKIQDLDFIVTHNYVPIPNFQILKVLDEKQLAVVSFFDTQYTIKFSRENLKAPSILEKVINVSTIDRKDFSKVQRYFHTLNEKFPLICLRRPTYTFKNIEYQETLNELLKLSDVQTVLFINTCDKWTKVRLTLNNFIKTDSIQADLLCAQKYLHIHVKENFLFLNNYKLNYVIQIPLVSNKLFTPDFIPILDMSVNKRVLLDKKKDIGFGLIDVSLFNKQIKLVCIQSNNLDLAVF